MAHNLDFVYNPYEESAGANLIAEERAEQINKHGFDIENDEFYRDNELIKAALFAINPKQFEWPFYWQDKFRDKIKQEKTEVQRLAAAGAFIAARIDQILRNKAARIDQILRNKTKA